MTSLTREIYAPTPSIQKFTTPVPVDKGGTGGINAIEAVENLGGIPKSKYNVANGYAKLELDSTLPVDLFPVESQGGPTLSGPDQLLIQESGTWLITNYDSNETYIITCSSGFVIRVGDTIYYRAPNTPGTYGFVINDKIVNVEIKSFYITQPSIVSPTNLSASASQETLLDTLFAADRSTDDGFSMSIAVNSNFTRLAVGAIKKDAGGVIDSGQVYVYTRSNDTWVQESIISASDKAASDWFGASVAFDNLGDRLVIGANNKTVGGLSSAGQVYIYIRFESNWVLESILNASDKATNDLFGSSVSLNSDGTRLAVGAYNKTVSAIAGAGKVYIYSRVNTVWTEEATISAADKVAGDAFGRSVSLDAGADRIAIGAYLRDEGGTDTGKVYIYTRSLLVWTLETTITASDKVAGDKFGVSVNLSKDSSRIAIGANARITSGSLDTGIMYIFVRDGSNWIQEYSFISNDNSSNSIFGSSCCFDSSLTKLIVGSPNKDSGDISNCGGVLTYNIEYNSLSQLRQRSIVNFTSSAFAATGNLLESTLEANDKEANSNYGIAVSVSKDGTRLAVGSRYKTVSGLAQAGQVYIYTKSGSLWVLETTLSASDKVAGDLFGTSVTLDGTGSRLIVGAIGKTVSGITGAGQVYIYTRVGSIWTQESTLSASDRVAGDAFGRSVSLTADGSKLAIGAQNKTVSGLTTAGKVYIYSRTGSSWTELTTVTASDKTAGDLYGRSVCFDYSGLRLAVGAAGKTVNTVTGAGQVYVYTVSGSTITEEAIISASDKVANDNFGCSVSFCESGARLAIGAFNKTVGGTAGAGQVYVYTRSGTAWSYDSILNYLDSYINDRFGASLSYDSSGSKLIVGSYKGSSDLPASGEVYTYITNYHIGSDWQLSDDPGFSNIIDSITNSSSNKITWQVTDLAQATSYYVRTKHNSNQLGYSDWSLTNKFTTKDLFIPNNELSIISAADKAASDQYGKSIALTPNGDRLFIGAFNKTVGGVTAAGQVYIYTRSGSTWVLETTLSAGDKAVDDVFGSALAVDAAGYRLAVGALGKDTGTTGQVYVYTRSGTVWTQETTIVASDRATNDSFGASLGMDNTGSRLAVGAHGKDVSGIVDAGQVYVYVRSGSVWTQEAVINAADKATNDWFGVSVAMSGDGLRLAVGAYGKTVGGISQAGLVYIYSRSGSTWTQDATISASDKAASDFFGSGLAMSDDGLTLAIGAYNKTVGGVTAAGQVYIYNLINLVWTQMAILSASDKAASDQYGFSMAFTDNNSILAVGSWKRNSNTIVDSGAVYMYD